MSANEIKERIICLIEDEEENGEEGAEKLAQDKAADDEKKFDPRRP